MIRRLAAAVASTALLASIAASSVAAGGPPSLAFYVDGIRYRTLGTPTDFSETGAPDFTFDSIYVLGSGLISVAEAGPGDPDFNGGRWAVYAITWAPGVAAVQYTNDQQILAAAEAGLLTISSSPIREFLCPVIPVPPSWS